MPKSFEAQGNGSCKKNALFGSPRNKGLHSILESIWRTRICMETSKSPRLWVANRQEQPQQREGPRVLPLEGSGGLLEGILETISVSQLEIRVQHEQPMTT